MTLSLKRFLKKEDFPCIEESKESERKMRDLQLDMLRVQQGIWHRRHRAIIVFEGFDAAGKGGAIRRLTERLDPRGFRVHPIGPPNSEEQGKHYLYRFWSALPEPGTIAIFDRSWYGRVLVERVEKLAEKSRWHQAYKEINEFEKMLTDDGIDLIKIFLGISRDEQFRRFEERIHDRYKLWKITEADVEARRKWDDYVEAVDDVFSRTDRRNARWHLIAADDKPYARIETLKTVTHEFKTYVKWIVDKAETHRGRDLARELKRLK